VIFFLSPNPYITNISTQIRSAGHVSRCVDGPGIFYFCLDRKKEDIFFCDRSTSKNPGFFLDSAHETVTVVFPLQIPTQHPCNLGAAEVVYVQRVAVPQILSREPPLGIQPKSCTEKPNLCSLDSTKKKCSQNVQETHNWPQKELTNSVDPPNKYS
jgi:hypothetical protein